MEVFDPARESPAKDYAGSLDDCAWRWTRSMNKNAVTMATAQYEQKCRNHGNGAVRTKMP